MATITGTSGSDSIYGTTGSDKINAGNGNDILYYNISLNNSSGTADIYTGGAGIDMVVLQFTFEQWNNAANQQQLTNYFSWLSSVKKNSVGEISNGLSSDFTFTFGASTLKIQMMEQLGVMVDGKWLGDSEYAVYTRQAPIAYDDTVNINEESAAVLIDVLNGAGADSVPDLLSNLQLTGTGPAHGTVQLVQSNLSDPSSWKFQYAVDNAYYQYLAAGAQTTDSFQYQLTDVNGKTSIATVTVTVEGVNDPASIGGTIGGRIDENSPTTVSELIVAADIDNPNDIFIVQSTTQTESKFGSYSIQENGIWKYTLDNTNPVIDALGEGDTSLQDHFTVYSSDGTPQLITIKITGKNDAALIGGDTTGTVVEAGSSNADGTPTTTGTLTASDVDNLSNKFIAATDVGTTYGKYSIDADGKWTYTLNNTNATVNALNSTSVPLNDAFSINSIDGTEQVINIKITGANDAATIGGNTTGTVVEAGSSNAGGTPTATGTLTASDVDNPSNKFIAATDVATTYGKYSIDADGKWTYTLNNTNATVNALNSTSVPLNDVFSINSIDGTEQVINIKITGANDAATIGGDTTGIVVEEGSSNAGGTPTATGTLTASDVDNLSNKFIAATDVGATYGKYSIDADGKWTYTLDNANTTVKALTSTSLSLFDKFYVQSIDGTLEQIAIRINGADDISPPIAMKDTLFVSSNTVVTLSTNVLLKNDTDIDKTKLSVTAITDASGSHGLTLNTDGTFSFNSGLSDGDVNSLTVYTFSYTVTNASTQLTAQADVTVNVVTPKVDVVFSPSNFGYFFYDAGYFVVPYDANGGDGDDVMIAGGRTDVLYGRAGNDALFGGDGNNGLFGEEGNDVLNGGAGNDYFYGGSGNDSFYGGSGADRFGLLADGSMDTIFDFSTADGDKILIDPLSFPELVQLSFDTKGAGILFYEKSTGGIFYGIDQIGLIGSDADRNLTAQSFELQM